MSELVSFEVKNFDCKLGCGRSLRFKVTDLASYQVGLRGFTVNCHNSGLSIHDVSVLLFNCSEYIELITVYESRGLLTVLVRDSYKGKLDQEFFDSLRERLIEELSEYNKVDSLQDYIIDSIAFITYDRIRFTNFLWLSQQAMLALKRRGM